MAVEAISNYNEFFNYSMYETENAWQIGCNIAFPLEMPNNVIRESIPRLSGVLEAQVFTQVKAEHRMMKLRVRAGRKKRKRRPKLSRNKDETATQRKTHIDMERNRRKQMNENLAILRSLMPESYSQRASIVGGAIEYVKELEQLVLSLEAQKLLSLQEAEIMKAGSQDAPTTTHNTSFSPPSFHVIFSEPQQIVSQNRNKFTLKSESATAEIEVTLIETHANLRIITKKNPRQLLKLVWNFQALRLAVLHINLTSLDPLVLYSISIKVEEGCPLTSVDSIAEAVHHLLRKIEEDVATLFLHF